MNSSFPSEIECTLTRPHSNHDLPGAALMAATRPSSHGVTTPVLARSASVRTDPWSASGTGGR
jgi:hypothetical protein